MDGIISLSEAKALGSKHYFTGEPCKHGHVCNRKVIDRSCVECNKEKSKRHAHKSMEWYYANLERAKVTRKDNYEKNKQAYIDRAKRNAAKDPERTRAYNRKYRKSDRGKAQSTNWVNGNKELHAQYVKNWKDNHPELVYEYTGTRRAAKLNATPACQTKEDRKEILAFYKEAKRLERETGIKHHVDHQIPLQHEFICGLHVPWNLQVLTESDNARKGNTFVLDEMPTQKQFTPAL